MYEVTIYPSTLSPWFTQVYAGLYNLERTGIARISIGSSFSHSELMDGVALSMDVKELSSGEKRSILIDLGDGPRFHAPETVEWFDVLVKRSFDESAIASFPDDIRRKIVPYGINFNCSSRNVPAFRLFLSNHLMRLRLIGKPKAKRIVNYWQHQLRFLMYEFRNNVSLFEDDFEGVPSLPTRYRVFFLTRLFEDRRNPGKPNDFSKFRIKLLQALKNRFGDCFYGGIVENSFSRKCVPGDLLCPKVSRREFTSILKQSDIMVSTLGVMKSNPWKLGEAIAGARCIVTEPLRYQLPVPLEEDVHIKSFTEVEECIRKCEDLINNPQEMARMKIRVSEYYQQHVKAEKLIEQIIRNAYRMESVGS